MVKIITSQPTTLEKIESPTYQQEKRSYLGMSQIGHECSRYLWYHFRWAYQAEFPARMIRLFNRGHREEPEVIKELEKIGITCHSMQAEFVAGWGHIKGHCDGMCDGVIEAPKTTHLLEIKTMSDKYFKEMVKKGCKAAKPIYYGQCQVGMHGYSLKRALFIAVNKNDDSWYIERIRYNKDEAKELIAKGEGIILSDVPPIKVYKPTWYLCKFCDARFVCHYNSAFDVTCRTCKHVSIEKFGKWVCGDTGLELDEDAQKAACELYSPVSND